MGAAQSALGGCCTCCTNRDKEEYVLQLTDATQLERDALQRQAEEEDARLAELHASACAEEQEQWRQQLQQPWVTPGQNKAAAPFVAFGFARGKPAVTSGNMESKPPKDFWKWSAQETLPETYTSHHGAGGFPTPPEYVANADMFEEPQYQSAVDRFEQRIGALLTGALHKPSLTAQVDTPKLQEFRLTAADKPDQATEVCSGASSLRTLPETPRWVLFKASNADPPPLPQPAFRATAMDQTEADVGLTPSSNGVPDPPLALSADLAEVAEAAEASEIDAAQVADSAEGGAGNPGRLSNCRSRVLLRSASCYQEKQQWSVNSEDSLVAQLAERMQRLRAGRVPDDQIPQLQRRSPSEPQLEAKLADRLEQQLSKERTGLGSALVRQKTWACDGGSNIGFVDKALEKRLEQQKLKAEGMRPAA